MNRSDSFRLSDVLRDTPVRALAAVSLGGVGGALARYGLTRAFPSAPDQFDLGIFLANAVGGFLIGVVMVVAVELKPGGAYLRPFVGVGFLGGFTSFSAYILDIGAAVDSGERGLALLFAFVSLAVALSAAAGGMYLTRRWDERRSRRRTSC
ncbi:fluoride efflux transporter FluC [Haloglycomyces albus]|uniref:fluoride efflux transporter FluC n=1 Tax=Haloglycomyces albus TaxID=526067 RepID=UPI00046CE5D1|nr:CrcB family protein [Haloglycomyces albus]